jgi:hypothetical protein
MALIIYALCALTSVTCAVLLFRAYLRAGSRLLLWSSLCFVGLGASNVLLVLDRIVFPNIDLQPLRLWAALVGFLLIVFGLIWEKD